MAMDPFPNRIRIFGVVLVIIAGLTLVLAGCRSRPNDSGGKTTAKKQSLVALGNQAVKNLGDERLAAFAVLAAWDKGYSVKQIVRAITEDRLGLTGNIADVKPDGRPQKFLKLGARPVWLAAAELGRINFKTGVQQRRAFWEIVEAQKATWTAWLLGVMAKGYSAEQITMYMLENRKPAILYLPYLGPIITEKKIDPKTGKVVMEDGKPVLNVVRPKFPPRFSEFDPEGIGGAEKFESDLAKDFDDLVAGKAELKPAAGATPAAGKTSPAPAKQAGGKFKPRAFRFELQQMPGKQLNTLRSSDVIVRIDAQGHVTGQYNVELFRSSKIAEVTIFEDGTFQGQAVYPKVKGQMIRMDIDGSRHEKTVTKTLFDGRTNTTEDNISIKKMFQGVLAVDYSKGSGFLFGESAMYRWKLD